MLPTVTDLLPTVSDCYRHASVTIGIKTFQAQLAEAFYTKMPTSSRLTSTSSRRCWVLCPSGGLPGLQNSLTGKVLLIEVKLRSSSFVLGAFVAQANPIKFEENEVVSWRIFKMPQSD